MPHREKKSAVQILFNCCAWEKVIKDSLRWQCCVTVSCHGVSERGLSVLLRPPQQTTVVLAQVLAAWKTGEWSNAFCDLEALLDQRSGLVVINTGAPERMCGKEEEACRAMYIRARHLLRTWLHNTIGSHLRNKISSSTDGKGWCFVWWRVCVSLRWFMCATRQTHSQRGCGSLCWTAVNCGWHGCCLSTWTAD